MMLLSQVKSTGYSGWFVWLCAICLFSSAAGCILGPGNLNTEENENNQGQNANSILTKLRLLGLLGVLALVVLLYIGLLFNGWCTFFYFKSTFTKNFT